MLVTLALRSRRFLLQVMLYLLAQCAFGSSGAYQQTITVEPDGKPSLQLTNTSAFAITAFVLVEFPSSGLEGRRYYDTYTNPPDRAIVPGGSVTLPLGYFHGSDVSKVRAEVRAVILEDGSSVGEPAWINAVLVRRIRLYDRLLSLHDLLKSEVGAGLSREAVLDKLRASKAEADTQLPNDDLRVIDDVAFDSAISTLQTKPPNREVNIDTIIQRYLKYLEGRAVQLERSRPALDAIRALPTAIPAPLANFGDPDQLSTDPGVSSRVLKKNNISASGNVEPQATLSSCEVSGSTAVATVESTCADSDGDTVTVNNKYLPKMTFVQYNATTGKTTTISWSSPEQFLAVGVCFPYTDCDGQPDVYLVEGGDYPEGGASILGIRGVEQGQSPVLFYWEFDTMQNPTYELCDAGCSSWYYDVDSADVRSYSTLWYFNYGCAVT